MKGQSNYIVGVGVLVFCVGFYAMNNFAMSYVIENARQDMNQNFARYESAVHTYMIINEGRTSVNNKINENNLASNLSDYASGNEVATGNAFCYLSPNPGWDHPKNDYRLTFAPDIAGGQCSPDDTDDLAWPSLRSRGILLLPVYMPPFQFYGTENDKLYTIQTRVKP